jgi:hypothetical protein
MRWDIYESPFGALTLVSGESGLGHARNRVVGADGALTGYRGGRHRKRALLDFEAATSSARFWTHQGQLALL